jgi:hypothetical protein
MKPTCHFEIWRKRSYTYDPNGVSVVSIDDTLMQMWVDEADARIFE